MGAADNPIIDVLRLNPRVAAERLAASGDTPEGWLDTFSEHLDRRRSAQSLGRILEVWGLSQAEAARLFGVSRQALGKWLKQGMPAERAEVLGDLAASTDLLVHYLKRDRIPGVVRRGFAAADGRSLLDLFENGDTRTILALCRQMFAFGNAQS